VSVASTLNELTTGLSGIESMPAGTGVLFDLGVDYKTIQIDMTRMLFPLDIIFINSTQGVVGVMRNVQPGETDVRLENETLPGARCFLEVNAGEAQGIEPGDNIAIEGYDQPAQQFNIGSLTNIMVAAMLAVWMVKMVDKALAPKPVRLLGGGKLPPGYKPVRLPAVVPREGQYSWLITDPETGEIMIKEGYSTLAKARESARAFAIRRARYAGEHPVKLRAYDRSPDTGNLEQGVVYEGRILIPGGEIVEDTHQEHLPATSPGLDILSAPKTGHPAVIPNELHRRPHRKDELEYFADSPEFLSQTIDSTGYRDKLDTTFQEAIARAKGPEETE
jgi:uncharacterized membrane protein (UPF0127 family)